MDNSVPVRIYTSVSREVHVMHPLRIPVMEDEYSIQEAPHPLCDEVGDECAFQIDHDDRVIWIDAGLGHDDQVRVIPLAVSHCWQERLSVACRDWLNYHRIPVLRSTELSV